MTNDNNNSTNTLNNKYERGDYMKTKHPLYQKLKEHGYEIADIARYLKLSYSYVSGIMTGRLPCKEEYNQKLQELVKEHEEKF